ncbi:carbohydrate ABC transporter membrane protein 1 (CUT1 family) [Paenibacillus cellulosilyticus]|uniref:Carbohydrate ABC transporter membrane protein 1 (CUT1 family) n=1 Tax=Paenibacillus cellulosilyticus TaxID=375489 RepID=A0A2V2YVR2_9BACL|nr:ABC transporter permease subunit [Paenibacillus cellulosilyticus]PWW05238.1 carbohydrate ABC transporter membrane protein 1 (CUT1 family) [Paenibacillus cellulosilyticus]QKS43562.1 sugar ABC transporter permease [Paenibacillus cellulosilyticus]
MSTPENKLVLSKVSLPDKKVLRKHAALRYVWKHRYMYLMLVPAVIYYIIYHYVPMYGAVIAFKDFSITKGIMGSPWAGFEHFQYLFGLDKFWRVFWNTVQISLLRLVFGFPLPLIVALLLNEVRRQLFKRSIQTIIYLPHFISWVILGGLMVNLLALDSGAVNSMLHGIGIGPIGFMSDPTYFRGTLIGSMIWKEFGWGTVIYMAALAAVNPQLYEAAMMDGANRWQRMLHITLPGIKSTIIILLILRLGSMMEAGFEQILILYNPAVYSVSDIIDTYVYRIGVTEGQFSIAAAVGLFKSVINFTLLIIANRLARMTGEQGIY